MSTPMLVSYILLWVVVAVLAVTTLAAVRQIGLIHARIPPVGARMASLGPAIGEEAPGFEVPDLAGRMTSLGSERGKNTLLVFVSTRCNSCRDVAPAIRSIAKSEARTFDTILVSDASVESMGEFAREHRLARLPIVVAPDVVERYGVTATPFGLIVDRDQRVVTKGIVNTIEHLESLIRAGEEDVDSLETFHERSNGKAKNLLHQAKVGGEDDV